MEDDEDGFDSDEGMNGLYVEGLADRIWDDNDWLISVWMV